MPQHLYIEANGRSLGIMSTSHVSDTSYDITWDGPNGTILSLPNTNTGIQRQPSDQDARLIDFRNDFLHARRSIGAASITANQVLTKIHSIEDDTNDMNEMIIIRLASNNYDRGVINIISNNEGSVRVTIQIGTGPIRPSNAVPTHIVEFTKEDIDVSGATTQLSVALKVLESTKNWVLDDLYEEAVKWSA